MIIPIIIIIIIFLIVRYLFINYQKDIFNWHCQNIYPFHKRLTKNELKYIHNCINLSWTELFRFLFIFHDEIILRLSFFSYSHRVTKGNINKSRIAYGSVMSPNQAYKFSLPILKERKIKIPCSVGSNLFFGGLGWDIDNNEFKIYYRFDDFDKLLDEYRKLSKGDNYLKKGILSWTYRDNKLIETKVYRYPLNKSETYLFSNKRTDIQKDRNYNIDEINDIGKEIIAKYAEKYYKLDTITVKNKDNFTLYFPSVL
jgi:hypothetical protein